MKNHKRGRPRSHSGLGSRTTSHHQFTMRDQQTNLCKVRRLERKCTDGAVRLRAALEGQIHNGISSADVWDKTVSFFTVRKALLFPNGYTQRSREALRVFPTAAEDVAPLCCS